MSAPIRTCVGCRQQAEQRHLVRLRTEGERVIVDRERTGGRGAWLHPGEGCLEKALRSRSLARALRTDARVDGAVLRAGLTGNTRKD